MPRKYCQGWVCFCLSVLLSVFGSIPRRAFSRMHEAGNQSTGFPQWLYFTVLKSVFSNEGDVSSYESMLSLTEWNTLVGPGSGARNWGQEMGSIIYVEHMCACVGFWGWQCAQMNGCSTGNGRVSGYICMAFSTIQLLLIDIVCILSKLGTFCWLNFKFSELFNLFIVI